MAKKSDDVPNGRAWEARLVSDPTKKIHVECYRFVDARAFARLVAGGAEVEVLETGAWLVERWQVRKAGVGGSAENAPHLEARKLPEGGPFRDVREIDFA